MPLTTENTAALLAGGVPIPEENTMLREGTMKPKPPAELQVEVLRAFYYKGELQKVGSKPVLPRVFALEMHAANKASVIPPEVPAPAVPVPAADPKPVAAPPSEVKAAAPKVDERAAGKKGGRDA